MAFNYDHDAFLDDDFFGRDAIYTPRDSGEQGVLTELTIPGALTDSDIPGAAVGSVEVSTNIRVILIINPGELDLGGGPSADTPDILIGCKASDVPTIKTRSMISVEGTVYRVTKVDPDETGWLNLQAAKDYL